jgi:hypothetical protein
MVYEKAVNGDVQSPGQVICSDRQYFTKINAIRAL